MVIYWLYWLHKLLLPSISLLPVNHLLWINHLSTDQYYAFTALSYGVGGNIYEYGDLLSFSHVITNAGGAYDGYSSFICPCDGRLCCVCPLFYCIFIHWFVNISYLYTLTFPNICVRSLRSYYPKHRPRSFCLFHPPLSLSNVSLSLTLSC